MISQIGMATGSSLETAAQPGSLGQEAFLNLLITQLKNQNPLEPMDGTEFVTQLAQFSELDEVRGVSTGIDSLKNYLASLNNFAAVSLLGQEVEFKGSDVTLQEGNPSDLRFRLPSDAAKVTVTVHDQEGKTVRSLVSGHTESGLQTVTWDGRDDNGQSLPSGTYRYELQAEDANGAALAVEQVQRGIVERIEYQEGNPILRVGECWIPLEEIYSIQSPRTE